MIKIQPIFGSFAERTQSSSSFRNGHAQMPRHPVSRRDVLKASGAIAAGLFVSPLNAAAPEPAAITRELIEAAGREGKVNDYTSFDLPLAEKIAKSFEARFPGIVVRVERTGGARAFQRI